MGTGAHLQSMMSQTCEKCSLNWSLTALNLTGYNFFVTADLDTKNCTAVRFLISKLSKYGNQHVTNWAPKTVQLYGFWRPYDIIHTTYNMYQ